MEKKHWWKIILVVLVFGVCGVVYIGVKTYQDAPPIPTYVDASGKTIISHETILRGQAVFLKYALMNYGSMFGDGAGRGPDFTAEALHHIALFMNESYAEELQSASSTPIDEYQRAAIEARVKKEIKFNRYQESSNATTLSPGQNIAYQRLIAFYQKVFGENAPTQGESSIRIHNSDEVRDLASFFFWGAWVCGVERPGESYSYTHNWPYDPSAGNEATTPTTLWSVFGLLGLILALGYVLYQRGRLDMFMKVEPNDQTKPFCSTETVSGFSPTPSQRATYKFFAVAAALFVLQVLAGLLTIHEFVAYTGIDIGVILPITISRSWHLQLALFWIATCWIAASIFSLPIMTGNERKGQLTLINILFGFLVILVLGTVAGVYLGPKGMLGTWWNFLGNQGWEFVELGKLWQIILFASLLLWAIIIIRGVMPHLKSKDRWAVPNWLAYTIGCVVLLLVSGFVATPETNFAIADFWRWCVIHMWVEAFLEVFTTVVVAYHMYLMGLVSWNSASRVIFLATILFLGSGMLGIAHNFYWNAKPEPTLAIGSVFSTLQVIPLILLSLEAWRYKRIPQLAQLNANAKKGSSKIFGQSSAFLFLLGVGFWNFIGAGVLGLIINLPIVNYYEHGTYLTVNHGHAAFMGVYGNLSLAVMMFCGRFLISSEKWNDKVMKNAFWSLNAGLMLMVLLDLFPAGILQFQAVLEHGLWFGRSNAFIMSEKFQALTWLRGVGTTLFIVGGVLPIAWFMLTRLSSIKQSTASVHILSDSSPERIEQDSLTPFAPPAV